MDIGVRDQKDEDPLTDRQLHTAVMNMIVAGGSPIFLCFYY